MEPVTTRDTISHLLEKIKFKESLVHHHKGKPVLEAKQDLPLPKSIEILKEGPFLPPRVSWSRSFIMKLNYSSLKAAIKMVTHNEKHSNCDGNNFH